MPTLHAACYNEDVGGKAGNDVASSSMKTIADLDLNQSQSSKHLVFAMDNFPGQNKNNAVIQLDTLMVEKFWAEKVKFLFIVVGHTKNTCNWLFNLIKKHHWK